MTTTTIRLTLELKSRVAAAAEQAGTTPHGFILQAIEDKASQHERQAAFHQLADQRLAAIIAGGKTIAWSDMRHYLEQRALGTATTPPESRAPDR